MQRHIAIEYIFSRAQTFIQNGSETPVLETLLSPVHLCAAVDSWSTKNFPFICPIMAMKVSCWCISGIGKIYCNMFLEKPRLKP